MTKEVSKSDVIRTLYDKGVPVAEIAKQMGILYQFAYNVILKYKETAVFKDKVIADGVKVKKANEKKSIGNRMFSRMNYQVVRGMMELITLQELTPTQWSMIKDFFGYCCAYCGITDTGDSRNGLVPDHLIAAAQYGDYVIGNVVPACHDCNDRRGKKPWKDWLTEHFPEDKDRRIAKVVQYLQEYPYTPLKRPLDRLALEEQEDFKAIMNDWENLWQRQRELRAKIERRRALQKN